MIGLANKIALVTGAARGLGAAIAERLASEQADVILVDVLDDVKETAARIKHSGRRASAYVVDLSEAGAIDNLAAEIGSRYGKLNILVNNAGISPKKDGRKYFVEEMDLDGWEIVLRVNLTSIFLLCKACLPMMKTNGGGRIINMSSQAGRTRPINTSGHYAASKAGLIGFSRAFANEVGPYGITVNCVAPGLIETPMFNAYSEETRKAALGNVPLRSFGTADDVAAAVAFLASDDARYITGATLDVNGGLFMT